MKYLVRISDRAERDVEQVRAWFQEQRAMTAATRWYGNLMSKVSTLEQHPQRCSLAAEAEEMGIEVRELLFGRKPGFIGFCFSMSRREWRFCEFVTLLAIHWQRKIHLLTLCLLEWNPRASWRTAHRAVAPVD